MKILYLLSDYNIYGGTPKKILELIKHSQNSCYLYMYESGNDEFKHLFEDAGAKISDGYTGRNIFKHVRSLLSIIDDNNIGKFNIVENFNQGYQVKAGANNFSLWAFFAI